MSENRRSHVSNRSPAAYIVKRITDSRFSGFWMCHSKVTNAISAQNTFKVKYISVEGVVITYSIYRNRRFIT